MPDRNIPHPPSPKLVTLPSRHREYIIDEILPCYEVHLVAGPSGAGKSTYVTQLLCLLHAGEEIFGRPSHPCEIVYLACDRSRAGIERTHERSLPTFDFPRYSLWSSPEFDGLESQSTLVLPKIHLLHPTARLLVIDAIGMMVDKINDYRCVANFLTKLAKTAERNNLTILGIHHSPKSKEGEGYGNPRQRVSGSMAWAGMTETILTIEPTDPRNPEDPRRTMWLCPRNAPEQKYEMIVDDAGRLIPFAPPETNDVKIEKRSSLRAAVAKQTSFTTQAAYEMFKTAELSRASGFRVLTAMVEEGKLEKLKTGVYQVPR